MNAWINAFLPGTGRAMCIVSNRFTCSVLSIFLSLCLFSGAAISASLPPAVTPGGALPSEGIAPLKQVDPEIFPIPPMIERPLGVDEGAKATVKQFHIQGVSDRPEFGISIADMEALANDQISQYEGGLTIGQMQLVADELTKAYRETGLILARVYVPSQDVQGGIVNLGVLEGKLGSVVVEGNKRYQQDVLLAPFAEVMGGVVTQEGIESAVLYLSDYPGLGSFSVFRPGKKVGETEILLKIQKEEGYIVTGSLDNHGSRYTGEYRARANGTIYNPTGAGDRLDASLLATLKPSNGFYGTLSYQRPVFGVRNSMGINYARNKYDVGKELSDQDISGESITGSLNLTHSFKRGRMENLSGKFDLSHKRSETKRPSVLLGQDKLTVATAQLDFDRVDTKWGNGGVTQGTFALSVGLPDSIGSMGRDGDGVSSRIGGSGTRAGGDFTKASFSLSRLQSINPTHSLSIRLNGQYSSDLLTSMEQMPIGGPNSVRAYAPSDLLVDKGIFGSVEWLMRAPGFQEKPAFLGKTWGEVLDLALFLDAATGYLNDPLATEEESVDAAGIGAGVQITLPQQLRARLDVAYPITARDPSNSREPQYYFNLNYRFH